MKQSMKSMVKAFWEDESGVGVVEMILILVGILTPYH